MELTLRELHAGIAGVRGVGTAVLARVCASAATNIRTEASPAQVTARSAAMAAAMLPASSGAPKTMDVGLRLSATSRRVASTPVGTARWWTRTTSDRLPENRASNRPMRYAIDPVTPRHADITRVRPSRTLRRSSADEYRRHEDSSCSFLQPGDVSPPHRRATGKLDTIRAFCAVHSSVLR